MVNFISSLFYDYIKTLLFNHNALIAQETATIDLKSSTELSLMIIELFDTNYEKLVKRKWFNAFLT